MSTNNPETTDAPTRPYLTDQQIIDVVKHACELWNTPETPYTIERLLEMGGIPQIITVTLETSEDEQEAWNILEHSITELNRAQKKLSEVVK